MVGANDSRDPGGHVGRFDKYLLSQLMIVFGFFSLVLVLVYWINRAVVLFDRLIANGESAGTFLEFTALSLPKVILLVLPMAAFAAAVYVANRLSGESELLVVQATGYSPWRLARPVAAFGLIVALMLSLLSHFLVPASVQELARRQAEVSGNLTSRLLTEGTFIHPARGLTFYVREISPRGELLEIFLSDSRSTATRTEYTAKQALLIRSDTGPKLVMYEGMAQTIDLESNRISITRFSDFSFDIGSLNTSLSATRSARNLPTGELLRASPATVLETGTSRARLLVMGHERISQTLLSLVAALVGFSTLLIGGFSRFGLWRQILVAIVLLILLKALDNSMISAAKKNEAAWPLVYVSNIAGLAVTAALLWLAERPAVFSRRKGARA
jgi:lipopolysaccharide export system permease protein